MKSNTNVDEFQSRPLPFKVNREANLCRSLYNGPDSGEKCPYEKCKYVHDIDQYFAEKPKDIAPVCPVYSTKGFCPRGLTCRFAGNHLDEGRNNCKQDGYDEAKANDSVNFISTGKNERKFILFVFGNTIFSI